MRRVPATVITGFLGAGKTSLVRHLLAFAGGRRLAVVVNEFGELGIDRELLLGCGNAGCGEDRSARLRRSRSAQQERFDRPSRLTALCQEIAARLRPGVKLVTAREGRAPLEVALGLAAAAEDDLAARLSVHDLEAEHDHDDFESFVVSSGVVHAVAAFLARLRVTIDRHDVLRVKGFVDRPGRDGAKSCRRSAIGCDNISIGLGKPARSARPALS
jgi:G3E family GTPase